MQEISINNRMSALYADSFMLPNSSTELRYELSRNNFNLRLGFNSVKRNS
jgi:hypothetical protein